MLLLSSDGENDSDGWGDPDCGLPVVQEVESTLQDGVVCVELRGRRDRLC